MLVYSWCFTCMNSKQTKLVSLLQIVFFFNTFQNRANLHRFMLLPKEIWLCRPDILVYFAFKFILDKRKRDHYRQGNWVREISQGWGVPTEASVEIPVECDNRDRKKFTKVPENKNHQGARDKKIVKIPETKKSSSRCPRIKKSSRCPRRTPWRVIKPRWGSRGGQLVPTNWNSRVQF